MRQGAFTTAPTLALKVVGLLFICFAVSPLLALARSAKGDIVETRDAPMAVTIFQPGKPHVVKTHTRLAFYQLKLTPYVAQSFDLSKTALGIWLTTSTSVESFTNAPVIIVIDGKEAARMNRLWTIRTGWRVTEETSIEDADLVRAIAQGKDVYLAVIMLDQTPPFNRMSFRLSPDQLEDCRAIVAKYSELLAASKR